MIIKSKVETKQSRINAIKLKINKNEKQQWEGGQIK